MKRSARCVVLVLLSTFSAFPLVARADVAAQTPALVLNGVTVVDTRTGKLTHDRAVVVEGGKITAILPAGGGPSTLV